MKDTQQARWIEWLMALTLPMLLLGLNLRIVSGHWFVRWEYNRRGFPSDPYGLSTSARIELATVCQDFLASHASIDLLADLRLPNGEPAFNDRELRHMSDVQNVYRALTIAGIVASAVWLASIGLALGGRGSARVSAALLRGSLVTLGLLILVGGFMLASWGQFFTTFHRIFFQGDTWIFPPSDTLIRLFPIRFWIDIAAVIVGLLVVESLTLGAVSSLLRRS